MYKLKIKEFRNKKYLTQQEVSNLTGVSRSYISELENAQHSATVQILMMLSMGLGISPNELIEQKEEAMEFIENRQKLKKKIIDLIIENNKEATSEFMKTLFDEIVSELERKS